MLKRGAARSNSVSKAGATASAPKKTSGEVVTNSIVRMFGAEGLKWWMRVTTQNPEFEFRAYLEGQGDSVSRLIFILLKNPNFPYH